MEFENLFVEDEGKIEAGATVYCRVMTRQSGMVSCTPSITSEDDIPQQNLATLTEMPSGKYVDFEVVIPKNLIRRPRDLVIVFNQIAVEAEDVERKQTVTLPFN